jgi:hypothetical protein
MDFTSLTADKTTSGSIRRWVNHADVDADAVLEDAQGLVFQTLRVREMRTVFADLAMLIGDSAKALPAGFLDPIRLTVKTNNIRLRLRGEEWMEDRRTYDNGSLTTGTPHDFAIYGEALQFDLAYEAAATLRLVGYKAPAFLSDAAKTNFLTARYPHILRAACLARAFAYRNSDERAASELQNLAAFIAKANAESDLTYRGLEPENEVA